MQTTIKQTTEIFLDFLEKAPSDLLENQSVIITNGVWNIHLDYDGEDYEKGMDSLRLLATGRPKLIKNFSASKNINEVLYSARNLADYFEHRNFTVSLEAKRNKLLNILLKIRIWSLARFGI